LGGTGIAVVALPVDDIIQTTKESEKASMSLIRQQGRVLNRENLKQREVEVSLPMCFSAGAGKQGKTNLPMIAIQGKSSSAMPQEALGTGGISMLGYGSFTDNMYQMCHHLTVITFNYTQKSGSNKRRRENWRMCQFRWTSTLMWLQITSILGLKQLNE
jgi:hypothetical protein